MSFATTWNSIPLPHATGEEVARFVALHPKWGSHIHQRTVSYFNDNPLDRHLTLVLSGQIIPPQAKAVKVVGDTFERISLLLGSRSPEALEENGHLPVYAIGGESPVILRSTLPVPATMLRDVLRISSHDSLMRRHKPNYARAIGIGYLALTKTPDAIINEIGYGDLLTGERRYKIVSFSEADRKMALKKRRTTDLTISPASKFGSVL